MWIIPSFACLLVLYLGELFPVYRDAIHKCIWGALGVATILFTRHLIAIYRKPISYRALCIRKDGLEYESLSRELSRIKWRDIVAIRVVREQATFDDIDGSYLETLWRIELTESRIVDIPDEPSNRSKLRGAFAKRLPGFDASAAARALSSGEPGMWACLEKSD